ncbi:MAG: prepilin-type N-terminal cleavage/methylation domain-containing protein [Candidatus Omnitrophica bacterium]|nr:prepilin-type N-terminal cleavage/methylation domain-containing protein [Candidatus Omnitrophota bacterium]MDD5477069.1 prepilin-type N-terminal cleavage/methylation domain-containing protein [Candidatus Omnitrophota bacterium]
MQSIRRRNKEAFTLVELLIVTALLAVVSLAIYATFNNGIKIWQKINEQAVEEDLDIFFEKFVLDLRNAFKFSGYNFSGKEKQVEFITLVDSQRMQKNTVGKVIYLYDPESRIISRSSLDYSQIYEGSAGLTQQLVRNVESLRFQYYFYDQGIKEYLWLDEWSKDGLPLAVRVELSLGQGRQSSEFVKTVSIPVSN